MKSGIHAIASFSIGIMFWLFAKSLYAGILCFISGFLIDVDHIIEYVMHYGWKNFSFKKFFTICEQTCKQVGDERFQKMHLIFHIGEFAILLWIILIYTKNIYLLAIAIGYSAHLIMDYIGNPTYLYFYSIIWRAIKDFNAEELLRKPED